MLTSVLLSLQNLSQKNGFSAMGSQFTHAGACYDASLGHLHETCTAAWVRHRSVAQQTAGYHDAVSPPHVDV